jgi:hypothetical protein
MKKYYKEIIITLAVLTWGICLSFTYSQFAECLSFLIALHLLHRCYKISFRYIRLKTQYKQ